MGELGRQAAVLLNTRGGVRVELELSRSAFTLHDPSRFILFYFYALPMCQVLPGLCCLFWSHSETQQLSYFLGCCATAACRVLSCVSYAVVCVLADLRARRLDAAFLILETIIHLPFSFPVVPLESFHLFLWPVSGRHHRVGEVE